MSILGFDCSDLDDINWKTLSEDFKFVIIKKSEGVTLTEKSYAFRSGYLPTSGLVWGDYHFLLPNDPIEAQLDNYFNGRIKNDLPPILDAEVQGITPAMVQAWLAGARQRSGRKPILYCDPGFLADNLQGQSFDAYLWVAAWQPNPPTHLGGFTELTLWQNSESGLQDGSLTGGGLDIDTYFGTIEELKAL